VGAIAPTAAVEAAMNRRQIIGLSAIVAISKENIMIKIIKIATMMTLGPTLLPGNAFAQQRSPKEQLVGTWTLVSIQSTAADGAKAPVFGAQPKGILMLDAGGHYALVLNDPGRAKWKSDPDSAVK
jgi:hypothetical protein